MKNRLVPIARTVGFVMIVLAAATSAFAETTTGGAPGTRWKPDTFWMSIVSTLVFGGIGIVLAIVGFKLFDLAIPFKLDAEVCEKQNMAVALLSAAMVLGVCIIIAAAVL